MGDDHQIDTLRRAMGVMQHHDAVTGTEKEHVAHDYARILSEAVTASEAIIAKSMFKLLPELNNLTKSPWPSFCNQLNLSICDVLEYRGPYSNGSGGNGVYVMLYNPTGWSLQSAWIRLPIFVPNEEPNQVDIRLELTHLGVGHRLPYQLIPISQHVRNIPERKITKNNMDLVFNAVGYGQPLVPVGFTSLYLSITEKTLPQWASNSYRTERYGSKSRCTTSSRTSGSMFYDLQVSNHGPRPVTVIANHTSGATQNIIMQMMYYYGETYGPQPSGAYVFLPKSGYVIQSFPDPEVKVTTNQQFVRLSR